MQQLERPVLKQMLKKSLSKLLLCYVILGMVLFALAACARCV